MKEQELLVKKPKKCGSKHKSKKEASRHISQVKLAAKKRVFKEKLARSLDQKKNAEQEYDKELREIKSNPEISTTNYGTQTNIRLTVYAYALGFERLGRRDFQEPFRSRKTGTGRRIKDLLSLLI